MEHDPDTLDRRLLNALLADGRASLREIARQLDVSPTTVSNRVAALEECGAIAGYVPLLDYGKLGYEDAAIFRLQVAADAHDAVCARLEASGAITAIYEVTGDFDLVAVGRFPDRDSLSDRIEALRGSPDIERAVTDVVLRSRLDVKGFQLSVE